MCAEAVPWRCHRSLVADALNIRGIPSGRDSIRERLSNACNSRHSHVWKACRSLIPLNKLRCCSGAVTATQPWARLRPLPVRHRRLTFRRPARSVAGTAARQARGTRAALLSAVLRWVRRSDDLLRRLPLCLHRPSLGCARPVDLHRHVALTRPWPRCSVGRSGSAYRLAEELQWGG